MLTDFWRAFIIAAIYFSLAMTFELYHKKDKK